MSSNEKVQRLGLYEQTLSQLLAQKKQFQAELIELDSALESLDGQQSAYQIIGNLMIKKESVSIKKDLEEKKEAISIRLKSCQKQEESTHEKAKSLQAEVLADMKGE